MTPLRRYQVPQEVGKVGNDSPTFVQPIAARADGIQALFARQLASASAADRTPHAAGTVKPPPPVPSPSSSSTDVNPSRRARARDAYTSPGPEADTEIEEITPPRKKPRLAAPTTESAHAPHGPGHKEGSRRATDEGMEVDVSADHDSDVELLSSPPPQVRNYLYPSLIILPPRALPTSLFASSAPARFDPHRYTIIVPPPTGPPAPLSSSTSTDTER